MRQRRGWEAWTEPASSEVGCRQPAVLLDFLSPLQVVRPGLLSRHALDQILQVPPETQLLQRVVQPTWRRRSLVTKLLDITTTSSLSSSATMWWKEGFLPNLWISKLSLYEPVVMQKYVSWGETWWMRWCLRGRMMWQSCRSTTQRGRPKYVCDHLWIWLVRVTKMASANK